MVNPKYAFELAHLRGKQFQQVTNYLRKTAPEAMQIPRCVIIDPSKRLKNEDLPFADGDRVRISSGKDKGKVGVVVGRYPDLGNAFYVAGVGSTKMVNPVENKIAGGEWTPIIDRYKVFDYQDLRLVSTLKNEEDRDEDVVIHSVALGPRRYNSFSNTHDRVRFAKNDPSIVIPWRREKPKPVENSLTTPAAVADVRTHFVTSLCEQPIPQGAIDQISNLDSRYKRSRYARRLNEHDIAGAQPPNMPTPPRTRKLLEQLEKMPKPDRPQFSREVEEFLGDEIKRGLLKRRQLETEALRQYK